MERQEIALPPCATLSLQLEGPVFHITLARPAARNAMSLMMLRELELALDAIEDAESVRCLVLRGSGGCFCAGGDIDDLSPHPDSASENEHDADTIAEENRQFGSLLQRIDQLPIPVIAVVEGAALGGGLGLVCVADVALAEDHARFGLTETRLGLIPAQILPFVARRIGHAHTRRLAVTGATVDGREATRLGIVHTSHGGTWALEAALANSLRAIGRCSPAALRETKSLVRSLGNPALDAFLDDAAQIFAETLKGGEAEEGLNAFLDKRLPEWTWDVEPKAKMSGEMWMPAALKRLAEAKAQKAQARKEAKAAKAAKKDSPKKGDSTKKERSKDSKKSKAKQSSDS